MTRSRILLVGAFGQGNPGDESLCAAFLRALDDHAVVVASSDPADTTRRHGVASVPARAGDAARALRHVDAVVVAGGTIFKRLHPAAGRRPNALLANTAALVAGARALGRPVALVGVGAGDLRGRLARRLSSWIARRADLVVLRDEESASVLTDAGVPSPFWIGADPVWADHDRLGDHLLAVTTPPRSVAGERRVVTVALSHLAGGETAERHLAAGLDELADTWTVRLQPWQTGGGAADERLAHRLAGRLPGAQIDPPPADVVDAARHLVATGTDVVVGLRFHALVAAGMAGRRFVAVAHEPKLAAVARRLDQLSVPPHASGEIYAAAVNGVLRRDPPPAATVEREADAARTGFAMLRLLLDDGELADPAALATLPLSSGGRTW